MGRHDQISRIFTVLRVLESNPRGFTLKQLHDRISADYEVNERSLRRDIEALENLGYDLERIESNADGERAKVIRINPTLRINRQLVLSPGELLALYMAKNLLTPLKETAFYQDLQRVFNQIDELLRERDREYLEEIASEVKFEPGPIWGLGIQPDIVDTVRAACENGQILNFIYQSVSSKSEKPRQVGPHFLYFAKGSLYLVAEDLNDQRVKIFALPRMKSAQMTEVPYEGSKVDPETYFSNSFGVFRVDEPESVRMLFDPEVAQYVKERRWHASQRVVSKADGRVEVSMQVGCTPDFIQWVLGFGARVEVLEPASIRHKITEEAEQIARKYGEFSQSKKMKTG